MYPLNIAALLLFVLYLPEPPCTRSTLELCYFVPLNFQVGVIYLTSLQIWTEDYKDTLALIGGENSVPFNILRCLEQSLTNKAKANYDVIGVSIQIWFEDFIVIVSYSFNWPLYNNYQHYLYKLNRN